MTGKHPPFTIIYAPLVKDHLQAIEQKYYSLIRSEIETQLRYEPDVETTNRKPFRYSLDLEAQWEIRFGPNNRFRVFYEVIQEERLVNILAIGEKRGNRLLIGGEEIEL